MKIFQNASFFTQQALRIFSDFHDKQFQEERKKKFLLSLSFLFSHGSVAFALVLFVLQVLRGEMELGTQIFIFSALSSFLSHITQFFQTFAHQYQDFLFVSEFLRFLDIPPFLDHSQEQYKLSSRKTPLIQFENVSFTYPETTVEVLKNVSFEIQPGEKVALIGVNGVGKSTIVKLLCRIYDPTKGRILIDSKDLKLIIIPTLIRFRFCFKIFRNMNFLCRKLLLWERPLNLFLHHVCERRR